MSYPSAIDVLTDCGAAATALETQHAAIDSLLRVFNKAMLGGASTDIAVRILDLFLDFCTRHFEHEEAFLRRLAVEGLNRHAAAHSMLKAKVRTVRESV